MVIKVTPGVLHTNTDPREAVNAGRRGFLDFLIKALSSAVGVAAAGSLAACGGSGEVAPALNSLAPPAVFAVGVAIGDPLADRVILWSHAKIPSSTANVGLTWQVASDAASAKISRTRNLTASEASSFSAEVDVTGLMAEAAYFYRFRDATGASSTVVITLTLPASNVTSVKFAVFSCSLYSEGTFLANNAAAGSDALILNMP